MNKKTKNHAIKINLSLKYRKQIKITKIKAHISVRYCGGQQMVAASEYSDTDVPFVIIFA